MGRMSTRTRLSTEERRAQLLAIGGELFAGRPYDEVSIEEVAEIAGVSTGLLYHYFPSKRAFFGAIVDHESAKLLAASAPDPTLPPLEQLKAGLEIYIDYARAHPDGFRMAQQQAAITGSEINAIDRERVTAQRDRMVAGFYLLLTAEGGPDLDAAGVEAAKIAIAGWLVFVPAAILNWLDNPTISRDQLRDLCVRTLWSAVGLGDAGSGDGSG